MEKSYLPVVFIGHGSPENAILDNEFTKEWAKFSTSIDKPKAILCISAHWLSKGIEVTSSSNPEIIYDFYGFQDELYKVSYPCKGSIELAELISSELKDFNVKLNPKAGFDHGTWSILKKMYPLADIPVVQLGIDYTAKPEVHFKIGERLQFLREKGVLIIGSGSLIHNLGDIDMYNKKSQYPYAIRFNEFIKEKIKEKDFSALIQYDKNKDTKLSHPTIEHYLPLLYVLGASKGEEEYFFNDKIINGSLSMLCVKFGK